MNKSPETKKSNKQNQQINPDEVLKVMLSTPAPKKRKSKKKPKKPKK
jgi:hypothetical protein